SRFLPEKTRETAQRFANSLYTIVKGQAATLSRLAETRRKAETAMRDDARLEAKRRKWAEQERREAADPSPDFAVLAGLPPGTDFDSLPRPQRRAIMRRIEKRITSRAKGPGTAERPAG
ncbi:MAG: hypothetical protein OEO83_18530, partial [Alphaproteobacteria bacterium]|nr:hypothetical protein [Alphaproteobacteria bacterium]